MIERSLEVLEKDSLNVIIRGKISEFQCDYSESDKDDFKFLYYK